MDFISKILADMPPIHTGETEILKQYQVTNSSVFSKSLQQQLADNSDFCWALTEYVLRFIDGAVKEGDHTLEIGSGVSTFVFALNKTNHICITPSDSEINRIKAYAEKESIGIDKITFINEFSEFALPKLTVSKPLDLILIDGKHAFPWPFIDWFYSVLHLKKGGTLIVDDTHLATGKILVDFMKKDPTWEYVKTLDSKTSIFIKQTDDIRDIAWHMQPFITESYESNFGSKIKGFLKKLK